MGLNKLMFTSFVELMISLKKTNHCWNILLSGAKYWVEMAQKQKEILIF